MEGVGSGGARGGGDLERTCPPAQCPPHNHRSADALLGSSKLNWAEIRNRKNIAKGATDPALTALTKSKIKKIKKIRDLFYSHLKNRCKRANNKLKI